MPVSSATTGRDFFWDHSPKCQSYRLPLENDYGQNTILTGYHLKSIFRTGCEFESYFWRHIRDFSKPVDNSLPNVLTSRGFFFYTRWKLPFEIPNIVREIQNLDEHVMHLYNGGTAVIRYINNWIPMFHHKSVSPDAVSVHQKYRTAPPRLWFCWREL